jgi:hypothetical protein
MHDPMVRTSFAKSCRRPTKSCRFWHGFEEDFRLGDRILLKPGTEVSITAAAGTDGAMTAAQISVRAPAR